MEMQFEPGPSALVVRNEEAGIAEQEQGEEPRLYSGHGVGGKLRILRRSSKKATPYDRPASGRHATAGGLPSSSGSAMSSSSLTSRLVGSASRLIASSASYFFPSLFGRRTLALPQSNPGPVQDAIVEEQERNEVTGHLTNKETQLMKKDTTVQGQEQLLVGVEKTERKEFDLARVEDMLKQKSWSREQVSRLTDLLNTRLIEHPPTVSRLAEAAFPQNVAVASVGDLTPQRDNENTGTPISEAQRWREELKPARTDCVPVEVARAYMGERTHLQSSLTQSFRATAHQMDRVAELQPPPGLGLAEDRYRSFPVLRSRTRSPAPPQFAKRSPLLDEQWMSMGPVRRTRHKLFHMNSSPYARALPSADPVVPPRTYISPPVQSSQTARKILDTLEMLSPSPKTKYKNDDPKEVGTSDRFSIQGSQNVHRNDNFDFSSVRETRPSNGRLEFGSRINYLVSSAGNKKETFTEDKSLVNRLLPSSEAGFFSSTTSIMSSSATASPLSHSNLTILSSTSDTIMSMQCESKPLFAFTLPPLKPESNSTITGLHSALPTIRKSSELNALPQKSMTSGNVLFNADAPFSIPFSVREERSGTDGLSLGKDKEVDRVEVGSRERPASLESGSPSSGSPFVFKMGVADSSLAAKGLSSVLRQGGVFGVQSEMQLSVSLQTTAPVSPPFMSISTPPVSSAITPTNASASVFGSLPGSAPLFKVSPSGQFFGASSITKPAFITPLTVEASSAPFTFSPPPPLVSCSTPTFSFGNSPGSVNVSFEASSSKLEDLYTAPVFNFTPPSERPVLPVAVSEEMSLPAPIFNFGAGALPSSAAITESDSTFCIGSGLPPSSGGLAEKSASFMSSGQVISSGEVTGSLLQQSFKFGGQATSEQLFGATPSSSFSSLDNSQASAGLEAPTRFSTRGSGLEKAGRKFVKVKRRK
ncbi:hypothetical protein L7F22_050540 [Adiantum nelumboides]|nr:hypothetical protein [Adiantum nelumboides]